MKTAEQMRKLQLDALMSKHSGDVGAVIGTAMQTMLSAPTTVGLNCGRWETMPVALAVATALELLGYQAVIEQCKEDGGTYSITVRWAPPPAAHGAVTA